ncbi:MAG: sigma 54-interacting transcriptional regulator [Lentisphaeraceae bacterium]|nr:sigma 54-interacting transcriptional regulator [Lentisphaeraceae bacterium]
MACLIRLDNGQIFNISNKIDIIGRGSSATIFLDDDGVSRNHAEIFMMSGCVEVIDLNSRNGIFVNSTKTRKSFLNDGDKVSIGSVDLVFSNETVDTNQTINMKMPDTKSSSSTHFPVAQSSASGRMELIQVRPEDSFLKSGSTELNPRYLEILFKSSLELNKYNGTDKLTNVAYAQIQRTLMPSLVVIKLLEEEMLIEKPMGSMEKISQELFDHCLKKGIAFLRRKMTPDSTNSAVICAPVMDSDKNIHGAIYIESSERNYEVEDLLFVRALASQVSLINLNDPAASQVKKPSKSASVIAQIDPEHLLILGSSDPVSHLKTRLSDLSSETEIMISGPPGTNRRIIANNIHCMSSHAHKPLTYVDCSALNLKSIQETLFGRSGLPNGKFHEAEAGTLFLNRITCLPMEVQNQISEFLRSGCIQPIGQGEPVPLRTQLIMGIRDLPEHAVESGTLCKELLELFKGKRIHIPRLHERKEDIPQIAAYHFNRYLQKYRKMGMILSNESEAKMVEYPWPGNDREIQLVLERAVLLCDHKELTPEYLFLP